MSQWLNLYNSFQEQNQAIDLVLVVVEGKNRVNIADVQVFSVLDAALKSIKAENIAIVFNKCGEQDDEEDILEFYNEARDQAQSTMLPDLKEEDVLLLRARTDIIGRKLKDQALKDAQMKLHNVLRDELFNFVQKKFSAVSSAAEVKQTSYAEIESKITDEETLAVLRKEQEAYKEKEAEF